MFRCRHLVLAAVFLASWMPLAAQEAQDRLCRDLGLYEDKVPWVRTIHSAAYRLLELEPKDVMGDKHWAEFGERHGYRFTRQGTDHRAASWALPHSTPDDRLRFAHDWCPVVRMAPQWMTVDQAYATIERAYARGVVYGALRSNLHVSALEGPAGVAARRMQR